MCRGSGQRGKREEGNILCMTAHHTRHSGQSGEPTEQLTKGLPIYHIVHTARCPDHNVLPHFQFGQVCSDVGTSDTGMALGVHVVTQSNYHLHEGGREGGEGRGGRTDRKHGKV